MYDAFLQRDLFPNQERRRLSNLASATMTTQDEVRGDRPRVRHVRRVLAAGLVPQPRKASSEQSCVSDNDNTGRLSNRVRTPWHNNPTMPVSLMSSALMGCLEAAQDDVDRASASDTSLANNLIDLSREEWKEEGEFQTACSSHLQEWTNATMCLEPIDYEEEPDVHFLEDPAAAWRDTLYVQAGSKSFKRDGWHQEGGLWVQRPHRVKFDAALYIEVTESVRIPAAILEFKNFDAGGQPLTQAACYHRNLVCCHLDDPGIQGRTRLPCVLVAITPRALDIGVAIIGVDGQTHMTSSCCHTDLAVDHLPAVANAFAVIRDTCEKIRVENAVALTSDLARYPMSLRSPFFSTFCDVRTGGEWHLKYLSPYSISERKLVFAARCTTSNEGENIDQHVIVKFTKHANYSKDVHMFLHSRDLAPQLFGFERLSNSWYAVVMEYCSPMEGWNTLIYDAMEDWTPEEKQTIIIQLRRLRSSLLEKGFVHGDLRNENIMAHREHGIRVLDFDWAGPAYETRFPTQLRHVEGDTRVAEQPIIPHHDHAMLQDRIAELS